MWFNPTIFYTFFFVFVHSMSIYFSQPGFIMCLPNSITGLFHRVCYSFLAIFIIIIIRNLFRLSSFVSYSTTFFCSCQDLQLRYLSFFDMRLALPFFARIVLPNTLCCPHIVRPLEVPILVPCRPRYFHSSISWVLSPI
jgi:hypothetical protein